MVLKNLTNQVSGHSFVIRVIKIIHEGKCTLCYTSLLQYLEA